MPAYRCNSMAELAHELSLAPVRLRDQHLRGAQSLIEIVEPARAYPRSFVVYHLTGYRSRLADDPEFPGTDLIADLVALIDQLSVVAPSELTEADCPHWVDAPSLCRRWNISAKTLARWRELGLAARWFARPGEPARALYEDRHVAWFEKQYAGRLARAAAYRRGDEEERRGWAQQAYALMAQTGCTLTEATRNLAAQMGRNVETIRSACRKFAPVSASSQEADGPAAEGSDRADPGSIYNRWSAGRTVQQIAVELDLPAATVQRLLVRGRAERLAATPVRYIYVAEFDHPDAERVVFAEPPGDAEPVSAPAPPPGVPAYLRELYRTPLLSAEQERRLFRRMNFLLHRAEQARKLLDPDYATEDAVDHIETLLARAAEIKNRIVSASLRLVVSIARKHLGRVAGMDLFDLVSEGNMALIRAVESFDFSRGNKLSTYASWAIMRQFGRVGVRARARAEHYQHAAADFRWCAAESDDAAGAALPNEEAEMHATISDALATLSAREREIVERRFGLGRHETHTLVQVSRHMNISRERVRQIESRCLQKIRKAIADRGLVSASCDR